MIYIINQHKGEFSELKTHLLSYKERLKSKRFNMYLRVDCQITDDQAEELYDIAESLPGQLWISRSPDEWGWGLSKCRAECKNAFRNVYPKPGDNKDKILFGCTNCIYIHDLNDKLADELEKPVLPTLILCKYRNDVYDYRTDWSYIPYISFESYINDDYRPDCTIMIPACYYDHIKYFIGEKYYPEEIILSEILGRMKCDHLAVIYTRIQEAWYNPNGMSANFNRKFMIENKKGFFKRATELIDKYIGYNPLEPTINLSNNKLKALVYDLATLGTSEQVLERYQGTIIEPLYWWAVKKWISNKDYKHKIQFIEDGSRY